MSQTILITGAAGRLGAMVSGHLEQLGHAVIRMDVGDDVQPGIINADLSVYDPAWARHFDGVDCVLHLAGEPAPRTSWGRIRRLNIDLTLNVFRAAAEHGVKKILFASSNWIMAGYRYRDERLTTGLEPLPVNPYGASKLFGERLGQCFASWYDMDVAALRIGSCRPEWSNIDQSHPPAMNAWQQEKFLSPDDWRQAVVKAIDAHGFGFTIINLMSDNPGSRWDVSPEKNGVGYVPGPGYPRRIPIADRLQTLLARCWFRTFHPLIKRWEDWLYLRP